MTTEGARTFHVPSLLALIVVITTPLAPLPAPAQQLRCASHQLPTAEYREALDQVHRAMSKDLGLVTLESACWNVDFSLAWFRTGEATDPDGVRWWWLSKCERASRSWSCDAPEKQRRIVIILHEPEGSRTIVATLPVDFPADRARSMVIRSATFAANPEMPLPACNQSAGDESAWKRIRSFNSRQGLKDESVQIELTDKDAYVDYLDSLRIFFDDQDKVKCWSEIVVVT